jgi:hypothetical protein
MDVERGLWTWRLDLSKSRWGRWRISQDTVWKFEFPQKSGMPWPSARVLGKQAHIRWISYFIRCKTYVSSESCLVSSSLHPVVSLKLFNPPDSKSFPKPFARQLGGELIRVFIIISTICTYKNAYIYIYVIIQNCLLHVSAVDRHLQVVTPLFKSW